MNHPPLVQRQPPDLVDAVLREYGELPTLCLTVAQAARLWQVDTAHAEGTLEQLVRKGCLRRTGTCYVREGSPQRSSTSDSGGDEVRSASVLGQH